MAVAFDAVGAGAAVLSTGNPSETHTSSGSNRWGLAAITVGTGTPTGSWTTFTKSVTWGGVAMTPLLAIDSNNTSTNGFLAVFGLQNQPTGAQTVTASVNKSPSVTILNTVSYTGVASVATAVSSFGDSTAPVLSVYSAVGRMVFAALGAGSAISGPTQTQRYLRNYDNGAAINNLLIQDAAGASTVTFGAANPGDQWAFIGVDLLPVTSGTLSPMRWNGSSWVATPLPRRWNGSSWVVTPSVP